MIEGQYERTLYTQVYECMLAIHCAQESEHAHAAGSGAAHTVDVVGITFKKGGTSVLADGCGGREIVRAADGDHFQLRCLCSK